MSTRFLVQGAQGVGKTTLLHAVRGEEINKWKITTVCGIARSLIKEGVSHGISTKKEDYYKYLFSFANAIKETEGHIILFDRSILDPIIYSRLVLGPKNEVEKFGLNIWETIKGYISGIFYIPIEFALEDDGVRASSRGEQLRFDLELQKVLMEIEISTFLISGDIKERRKLVISTLNSVINLSP